MIVSPENFTNVERRVTETSRSGRETSYCIVKRGPNDISRLLPVMVDTLSDFRIHLTELSVQTILITVQVYLLIPLTNRIECYFWPRQAWDRTQQMAYILEGIFWIKFAWTIITLWLKISWDTTPKPPSKPNMTYHLCGHRKYDSMNI